MEANSLPQEKGVKMQFGPDQIIACPRCTGLAKYGTLSSFNTADARCWTDGKLVYPWCWSPPAVVMCRHCGECYWLAKAEKVGTVDQDERDRTLIGKLIKDLDLHGIRLILDRQPSAPGWVLQMADLSLPGVRAMIDELRKEDLLPEGAEVGTVDPLSGEGQQVDPRWVFAEKVREPTEEEYYRAFEMGLAKSPAQQRQLRILAWWRRNDAFRDAPQAPARGIPVAPGSARTNLEALAQLFDEGDEHHDRLMKAEVLRELGEFESAKQVLSRVHSSDLAPVVRQLQSLCDRGDTCVRELEPHSF